MSDVRPLRANRRIHPEFFAAPAAEADKLGRFCMIFSGGADRSADAWRQYESPGQRPSSEITASSFDPAFRIVLGAMRECRLFGVTAKLMRDNAGAPEAWLARYAAPSGKVLDVNVGADGVRDDLEAWWWLATHAEPLISCDASALDASTLFTLAGGPLFSTARGWSRPLVEHAKARAEVPGTVVFQPYAAGTGHWGAIVFAGPGLAGDLAREAVLRWQLPETECQRSECVPGILGAQESCTFWTGTITAQNFEKTIVSTLKRAAKDPGIPRDAIRGLAAAEGVAIAEGRGPATVPESLDALVATIVGEKAVEADPVSASTIELALRTLQVIADAGTSERARCVSEEARAEFRQELAGLRARLLAAQATRRVRTQASNAVPVPALREIPPLPVNWRSSWLHLMLDDVVAMLGVIRDETGAVPLVRMNDRSHCELRSDWDVRERLATIGGHPTDARIGEWMALVDGQRVLLWWPDVSPRPTARDTADGWETESWGHAELRVMGATPTKVLRSEWSYPTGSELKQEKFAGPGPWRDVDWKLLLSKTKAVAALVSGPLGATAPLELRDTLTLPTAAANARSGLRQLMGRWFYSEVQLPD